MRHPEISDRQREILLKTLELYISTGAPVGSHALTEAVDASSSTIRAELADLESSGLLTHPHFRGPRAHRRRVPLLRGRPHVRPCQGELFEAPEGYGNLDELLRGVSQGMSEVTRLLAVVAGPSALGDSLSRVDYLPLVDGALLVVSMESGATSSTTLTLPTFVEGDELREIFAALNSWLGGRSVGGDLELATAAGRCSRTTTRSSSGRYSRPSRSLGGPPTAGCSCAAPRPCSRAWTTSTPRASRRSWRSSSAGAGFSG